MQTANMAKSLSHEFKFAARTDPHLYEAFNGLVMRAGSRGVKFRGRKLGVEAAINALITELMRLPEAEQFAILSRGVAGFEAMMESDETKNPPVTLNGRPGAQDSPPEASVSPARDVRTGKVTPPTAAPGRRRKSS